MAREVAVLRDRLALSDAQRVRLGRLAETMNALGALSLQLNTLDAERIKDLCVGRAPSLVGARHAALFAVDPATGELLLERHSDAALRGLACRLGPGEDSLLDRAVSSQEILVVNDIAVFREGLGDAFRACPALAGVRRACLVAPLRVSQALVGVLVLMDREDEAAFDAVNDLPCVQQVTQLIGTALRNLQLYELVVAQARVDPLTGVFNRRAFWELLEREVARSRRYQRPLSALMVDLDDFKGINDRHGHKEGDEVLILVAGMLRSRLRAVDIVGRYGGDEFVVLLPETDLAGARIVAGRLLTAVRDLATPSGVKPTCSIGAASLPEACTPEGLIAAADRGLYEAKSAGRDALGG